MRKNLYALLLSCAIPLASWSQNLIIPKKNVIDKKWPKNQSYQMNWSILRDTARIAIGTVNTKVELLPNQIQVISQVKMKSNPSSWIDTTIVNKDDLSPIYHSSYNAQRDMNIRFRNGHVKGFYKDKVTAKITDIEQVVQTGYFDSNFYPMLVNWLPLKKDYKADFNIYDYNPKGKTGILKARILGVTEGKYLSGKLGERKVWVVEVSDEIGGAADGKSIYLIDQFSRQLYKQKIIAGQRVMEMTLVED